MQKIYLKLSVIIVNYNVKHFLDQCLSSVLSAARHCETEIFVVDNDSVDGSCAMVKQKFPFVKLIENKKNYGFSYANNQAIKIAQGEYILLLNPDTLIDEETLKKVVDFMDSHPEGGGLGVNMIDGKGKFLPESKRGLPTPRVAFYKIFGLTKLFPKSKKFGQYHLSYLDKNEIHEVDILAGAFMLLRKTVLDKIGLLDETFFMYGEDIDLSYRITLAGYKNYYFPQTTIIHYKGESTKKGSINYVLVFYRAMIIFAKKHFSSRRANLFSLLINIAIYIRASLAIVYQFLQNILTPLIDLIIIFAGLLIITPIWSYITIQNDYKANIFFPMIIIYSFIWILSILFQGGYDKPLKIKNIYIGIGIGTIIILLVYSLLSVEYRFSRTLIFLSTAWNLLFIPTIRFLLHLTKFSIFRILLQKNKRVAIVGDKNECENILNLLNTNNPYIKIVAFVNPDNNNISDFFEGNIKQLSDIVTINKIDEIIFCTNNLQTQQIIATMLELKNTGVDYKIASSDGFSIIGSNSINRSGELYSIDINSVSKPENKRKKRLFDFFVSLLFLFFYPFIFLFMKNRIKMLKNLFLIFIGKRTFVAYSSLNSDGAFLPELKKGIFSPFNLYKRTIINEETKMRINILYAKDYHIINDFKIVFKLWKQIGKY